MVSRKGIVLAGGSGSRLFSNNKWCIKTVVADIQQAHDLLSNFSSYVSRNQRHTANIDSK